MDQPARQAALQPRHSLEAVLHAQVLDRVKLKAATYGQDPMAAAPAHSNGTSSAEAGCGQHKILPERVQALYESWIMPLTKQVEVQYLLRRLSC